MNKAQLRAAIMKDAQREDYVTEIDRYIEQGEGEIAAQLDGYILSDVLTDADRIETNLYALANGVTVMRRAKHNDPLDQVDETIAHQYKDLPDVRMYTMRDASIFFSGIPPVGAEIEIEWYGMPQPLVGDESTNSLITEYPQLYIEAAQIFVYRRAKNWDAADRMKNSITALIADINRRTRKKLGGARSANPYNVGFRSSY